MPNADTFGARLREVREKLGDTQEAFANRIGIVAKRKGVAVSEMEHGEREPKMAELERIVADSPYAARWLLTGAEPKVERPESKDRAALLKILHVMREWEASPQAEAPGASMDQAVEEHDVDDDSEGEDRRAG